MRRQFLLLEKHANAQGLQLKEEDFSPRLGDQDLLIETSYSGINFADVMMSLGLYQDAPSLPYIPGYEVSGVVKEKGAKVTNFNIGDQVFAGTRFGGYASHLVVHESWCFHRPKHLSLSESAALPVNFMTAYLALFEFGRIRQGDKILLEGASGGVGLMAIQMAKEVKAQVYGLTTSAHKKEFIQSFGAQALTMNEFKESQLNQFDFILNSSAGKDLKLQYNRLAKSGKIICIGVQGGINQGKRNWVRFLHRVLSTPRYAMIKLIMDSKMVGGFNALNYFDDPKIQLRMSEAINKTKLKPFVGKILKAQQAQEALSLLANKKITGKVLLQWKEEKSDV